MPLMTSYRHKKMLLMCLYRHKNDAFNEFIQRRKICFAFGEFIQI